MDVVLTASSCMRNTAVNSNCKQHGTCSFWLTSADDGMCLQAGDCADGDSCPYSHNAFELSLHPER